MIFLLMILLFHYVSCTTCFRFSSPFNCVKYRH
ncbi:hypothetical protein LINGRAHAP2_LOCUS12404 [Linum grandiflorum]